MSRYYFGHEQVYRRLEAEGHVAWDKRAYDDFCMRPFLEHALARLALPPGSSALEIGCGTGPISCLLAARGFDVLGLDVSETAVRMASRHASERGLSAEFRVQDVVELTGERSYDLIVDGHCLHCIVFDADRTRLYAALKQLVGRSGVLVIETMVRHPALHIPGFLLDDDGILWTKSDEGEPEDLRRIGDDLYRPNRRILSEEQMTAELLRAGFTAEWCRIKHQEDPQEPWEYQAIVRSQ
jgi:SAM-dependent methyltransferase